MGGQAKNDPPGLHGFKPEEGDLSLLIVEWEAEARGAFWRALWAFLRRRR